MLFSTRRQPNLTFNSCCDASAALRLADGTLVIASDEDKQNRARAFSPLGGQPLSLLGLNDLLEVESDKEGDLEAACRVGDVSFWIGSHGLNKKGEPRPSRCRLLAAWVTTVGADLSFRGLGKPYKLLRDDLLGRPELAGADGLPPEEGGLNIEGLAADAHEHLLLGFRSPLVNGHALVLPLLNPFGVVAGEERARFGPAHLLDLNGRGIRDMEWCPPLDSHLIVAGPPGSQGSFAVYRWKDGAATDLQLDIADLNPESILLEPSDPAGLWVLCDDGDREDCQAKDKADRSFRVVRFD